MSDTASFYNVGGHKLLVNASYLAPPPNFVPSPENSVSDASYSLNENDELVNRKHRNSKSPKYQCDESYNPTVEWLLQTLFPRLDPRSPPHWVQPLRQKLLEFVKNNTVENVDAITPRLKRYLRISQSGRLSVGLAAASILRLHPDVSENLTLNKDAPVVSVLPTPLKEMIIYGKFVPMEHLLYGEALLAGCVSHESLSGQPMAAEPYPLRLDRPPPEEFVATIKKTDVLRGVTSHALTLAPRFPHLAARMHGLVHHLSVFLISKRMPVTAGLKLYNGFFYEFQKQLSLMSVMPVNSFPRWLEESVTAQYSQDLAFNRQ